MLGHSCIIATISQESNHGVCGGKGEILCCDIQAYNRHQNKGNAAAWPEKRVRRAVPEVLREEAQC